MRLLLFNSVVNDFGALLRSKCLKNGEKHLWFCATFQSRYWKHNSMITKLKIKRQYFFLMQMICGNKPQNLLSLLKRWSFIKVRNAFAWNKAQIHNMICNMKPWNFALFCRNPVQKHMKRYKKYLSQILLLRR